MLQTSKQNQAGDAENTGGRGLVKIGGVDCTYRQAEYIQALVRGMSGTAAARFAGFSCPESAHCRLSREDKINRAISAEFQRLVLTEGAPKAYTAALGILDDEHAPQGVKWKVAQWFLEAAGAKPDHVAASASQNGHKALEDMSLAELETIASAARQRLETTPVIQGTARTIEQPKQQRTPSTDPSDSAENLIE